MPQLRIEAVGSADGGNDRVVVLVLDQMATHSGHFTTWQLLIPGPNTQTDWVVDRKAC